MIFRLQSQMQPSNFDLGGEDENNAEQEALIAPALAMRAFYHLFYGYIRSNSQIRPLDRRF